MPILWHELSGMKGKRLRVTQKSDPSTTKEMKASVLIASGMSFCVTLGETDLKHLTVIKQKPKT